MKRLLCLMLLIFTVQASTVPKKNIITVSKVQYKEQWAFTREEVQLRCAKDGALYVINESTLAQYPLNELAKQHMQQRKVQGQPVETILLDDPTIPGNKMSLAPFRERAQQLCQ